MSGVRIAVVGLGFGGDFVPIYLRHPDVERVVLVDPDAARLASVGEKFGVSDRFPGFEQLLDADVVDAVHLTSPVAHHAAQSVAALRAGLHTACAVPMATTLPDIEAIIAARRESGKNYMMMETSVYGREFFFVDELVRSGGTGPLTFLRGMHLQDLDGFPRYWMGYPPMTYSTHALSPLLAVSGARVESVRCLGSGTLTSERRGDFDNTFPLESALFRLDRDNLAAEVTMSFFQVGRAYQEGYCVSGQDMSVEWPQAEGGPVAVHRLQPLQPDHRGRGANVELVAPPDRAERLPQEIAPFTRATDFDPGHGLPTVRIGSGHGGSHPHLVHEFISSVVASSPPWVDAARAAEWTAPGICGHSSALRGGEEVRVPHYR